MVLSMKSKFPALIVLCITILCGAVSAADKVKSCNGSSWKYGEFGELDKLSLGKEISFERLLRVSLKKLGKEAVLLSNVEPLPDQRDVYISDLLKFLEGTPEKRYSCLKNEYQKGDVLREFKESEEYETRSGYILLRKSKPIAYMYESIVQI